MTTYNTGNSVPSGDARDRFDNSQTFDEVVNSVLPTTETRLAREIRTLSGLEYQVNDFLLSMGFEATHLTYVVGTPLTVNRPTQLIDYNGSVFKVKMPATFPVSLTGTWATDAPRLVDVGDASLRQLLASPAGAANVFDGARSIAARNAETVNLLDYADPTLADCTVGVKAACAYAKGLNRAVHFLVPEGNFTVSEKIDFDFADFSTIEMLGRFTALPGGSLRFGSTSRNVFGHRITGVDVRRTEIQVSGATYGAEFTNLAFSFIEVARVNNFQSGVGFTATQGNGGFSYNQIWLGLIHDNQYNLIATASADGYTNENSYYGGSFNHSSLYPTSVGQTFNIYVIDYAAHPLNNNRFYGPSLEDNQPDAIAARLEGQSNALLMPRLENPSNIPGYPVVLPSNSQECYVVGLYGMRSSNIQDLGRYNTVETLDGKFYKTQGPVAAMRLMNAASSANKVFEVYGADSLPHGNITGGGVLTMSKIVSTGGLNATIPNFSSNAQAIAGGLVAGDFYFHSDGAVFKVV